MAFLQPNWYNQLVEAIAIEQLQQQAAQAATAQLPRIPTGVEVSCNGACITCPRQCMDRHAPYSGIEWDIEPRIIFVDNEVICGYAEGVCEACIHHDKCSL